MKAKVQKPPTSLSKEGRLTWKKLAKEYELEDAGGLQLLKIYCEAYDRAQECRRWIEKKGMVYLDRFKQPRPHPLLTAEKESKAIMLTALRQMNLDVMPANPHVGRPSGK